MGEYLMKRPALHSCVSFAALTAVAGIVAVSAAPAFAAEQAPADKSVDASKDTLSEIVVTAVKGGQSKLNTSVSVSSVSNDQITNFNPTSDAELMRFLPGIQVPGNSGPGGNANITIRGLTTPSGGSPFLQVQEDGLPVVLNGDMSFANNDYFTHMGPIDERVEAIRGGSASTFASQAVGGVVNYISKTSKSDGGYVELEKGLNYDYTKVKGLLSSSVNDSTYFNVGGYFDIGHGTRHASYNVSDSYEIKGNITKEFADSRNFIRILFKIADTQEPTYNAGLVTGNLNGSSYSGFAAAPGFDYRDQAGTYSIFNRQWTVVNYDGTDASRANTQTVQNNGIVTHQRLFQLQFHYNLSDAITVDENGRVGFVNGSFAAGFYGGTLASGLIGSTIPNSANTIGSFIYANGANAGQVYSGSVINTNTDIYSHMRDLNSVANDLSLSGKFTMGSLLATAHAGWFYFDQHVGIDWHPNVTFSEGSNGANPAMLDPVSGANGTGNLLAVNGQAGYNNNWGTGTCCAQSYDLDYAINAPYANLVLDLDKFSLDGGVREELFHYQGTQWGGSGASSVSTVNVTQIDPRTGKPVVTAIPYAFLDTPTYFNFNQHATNWTVGLLYKATGNTSVFARAAHGVRFNADRLAWTGNANPDGSLNAAGLASERYPVDQYEIGVKSRGALFGGHYTVEATLFKTKYSISSFGIGANCAPIDPSYSVNTTCTLTSNYKDTGYELFSTYALGRFNLVANLTGDFSNYTTPGAASKHSALAHLAYTVQASYRPTDASTLGVSVTGNTSTPQYVGATEYSYPGSAVFTAFAKIWLTRNLQAGVDVYNLFNALALQGGQPGTVGGGFYSATVADGRSVKGSLKFTF
jgi:outer membrane receptor protein involved in Fe transport